MNGLKVQDMLIDVDGGGTELSALLFKALLPRRFPKIMQHEADKWLKGKSPKRWTLSAVCLNTRAWLKRFGEEAQKRIICKRDAVKYLNRTKRVLELFKNGLKILISDAPRRVVRLCAERKMHKISAYLMLKTTVFDQVFLPTTCVTGRSLLTGEN